MQNKYPFFLKKLDRDHKLSVQYHSDWDVKDSCFGITHTLSEFCLKKVRYFTEEPKYSVEGLYILPKDVYPKQIISDLKYLNNLEVTRELMNLFFDEHVYRFKDQHVSEFLKEQLNTNIDLILRANLLLDAQRLSIFDVKFIDKKFYKDDFNADFKEKKEPIMVRSGQHIAWERTNKPSVVNTMRAWYREEVVHNQINFNYTHRERPTFLEAPLTAGTGNIPMPPRREEL